MTATREQPIDTYKTSRASAWFYYATGLLFILLFAGAPIYLFVVPGNYKDSGNLFIICFPIFVAVLIGCVNFACANTRIEIYPDRICKVNPFRSSQLMLDDIERFFVSSKAGIVLVPKQPGHKKMFLEITIERSGELESWLNHHLNN